VLTALLAGLPAQELRGANVGDLRVTEHRGGVLRVRGKGNKDRAVPIEPALIEVLNAYLASRATRFPPSARLRTRGPELNRWPASAPPFVGADGHPNHPRAAALLERTAAWGSNVPRLAATSARPAYRTGDHHAAGRDGEKPADPGLRAPTAGANGTASAPERGCSALLRGQVCGRRAIHAPLVDRTDSPMPATKRAISPNQTRWDLPVSGQGCLRTGWRGQRRRTNRTGAGAQLFDHPPVTFPRLPLRCVPHTGRVVLSADDYGLVDQRLIAAPIMI
jgi:hypothetical protein